MERDYDDWKLDSDDDQHNGCAGDDYLMGGMPADFQDDE